MLLTPAGATGGAPVQGRDRRPVNIFPPPEIKSPVSISLAMASARPIPPLPKNVSQWANSSLLLPMDAKKHFYPPSSSLARLRQDPPELARACPGVCSAQTLNARLARNRLVGQTIINTGSTAFFVNTALFSVVAFVLCSRAAAAVAVLARPAARWQQGGCCQSVLGAQGRGGRGPVAPPASSHV